MSDEELLRYFRRGLIPGPRESEEAFLERVKKSPPLSLPEWEEAQDVTAPLYRAGVDWMPIHYSNKKLAWWEGAATWIGETPTIQLRTGFRKGRYFGYRRSEVLAHEAVHAMRLSFHEPAFEEMLAYATAASAWKRWVGPLFRRTWEPLAVTGAIFLGWVTPLIPLFVVGSLLAHLIWRQRLFRRCCKQFPLYAIVCMTDEEIRHSRFTNNGSLREQLLGVLSRLVE